jgi:hypothetical protein
MYKALFYKELIKTGKILLLLFILLIAIAVYFIISVNQIFRIEGGVQVWSSMIIKDLTILPLIVQYFPLLAGVMLAVVQFMPEMTDKRLKLTLHLPLPEAKIVSTMLFFGLLMLSVLFLALYIVLITFLIPFFTKEILLATTWLFIPCMLGGFSAYILAAWICFEPAWKQRAFNAGISVGMVSLFFMQAKSGAYISFITILLFVTLWVYLFPFHSVARFKDNEL